jgi:signal transduction histidine kinase
LSAQQAAERRTTVDLLGLTREVVGLFALKARAAKLEIGVSGGPGDGAAAWEGYPGIYSQVLLNLLANAERYAYPDGGGQVHVRVETADGGRGYRVAVRDFGRGIPESDLAKVWDPFFTTGRAQGGTGLGLAIVRNLVTTALGGRVGIESAPGQGTTVWLEFPKAAPDAKPGSAGKDAAT